MERDGSNHDEVFMRQSLLFADNLRELKNLRNQLYEAAEYFEDSYTKEEHKQIVVKSLKDYAVKALINTVDHLGSVASRVSNLFDEKIAHVNGIDISLQCIHQRMQTCQEYVARGGLSQQLFLIPTPRHHKIYILPETKQFSSSKTNSSRLRADDNLHQIRDVQVTVIETPGINVFREWHKSPSPRHLSRQVNNFTFTRPSIIQKQEEQVTCGSQFPLMRSGSLLKRSISPSYNRQQNKRCQARHVELEARMCRLNLKNPLEPRTRRTVSLSAAAGRDRDRASDFEQHSGKGKRMFKTLLSLRKPRNDGVFYKFLDEY